MESVSKLLSGIAVSEHEAHFMDSSAINVYAYRVEKHTDIGSALTKIVSMCENEKQYAEVSITESQECCVRMDCPTTGDLRENCAKTVGYGLSKLQTALATVGTATAAAYIPAIKNDGTKPYAVITVNLLEKAEAVDKGYLRAVFAKCKNFQKLASRIPYMAVIESEQELDSTARSHAVFANGDTRILARPSMLIDASKVKLTPKIRSRLHAIGYDIREAVVGQGACKTIGALTEQVATMLRKPLVNQAGRAQLRVIAEASAYDAKNAASAIITKSDSQGRCFIQLYNSAGDQCYLNDDNARVLQEALLRAKFNAKVIRTWCGTSLSILTSDLVVKGKNANETKMVEMRNRLHSHLAICVRKMFGVRTVTETYEGDAYNSPDFLCEMAAGIASNPDFEYAHMNIKPAALQASTEDGHWHTAVIDEHGNGITSAGADGHRHTIQGHAVNESAEHTHLFQNFFGLVRKAKTSFAVHERLTASYIKATSLVESVFGRLEQVEVCSGDKPQVRFIARIQDDLVETAELAIGLGKLAEHVAVTEAHVDTLLVEAHPVADGGQLAPSIVAEVSERIESLGIAKRHPANDGRMLFTIPAFSESHFAQNEATRDTNNRMAMLTKALTAGTGTPFSVVVIKRNAGERVAFQHAAYTMVQAPRINEYARSCIVADRVTERRGSSIRETFYTASKPGYLLARLERDGRVRCGYLISAGLQEDNVIAAEATALIDL
jgi:hypothetical protein